MSELDDIAIERRIVKVSCEIHRSADVFHPDGHEVEHLLIDRKQLKALLLELIGEDIDNHTEVKGASGDWIMHGYNGATAKIRNRIEEL